MLRANRPILAFFDSIKALRVRQLAMILKAGYDPNLMINARGQNGLQFMINYFGATDAHYRLQAPINKSAYLSIAKLLLDSGLDPNAMDLLADETVIFDAIRYNDREMVALLLNYVDLSLRNKAGETALMCAARFGSKQVTRMILEHLRHLEMDGYFLRQRNRFGLTPLEIARSENLEAAKVITKHLISYGQHTGAALARSVSHHQLDPRRGAGAYRPSPPAAAVVAAAHHRAHRELLHADDYISPSDYDSDVPLLAATGAPRPLVRRAPPPLAPVSSMDQAMRRGPAYNYQAYYDPKAAEFSQYLLEQQQADQLEQSTGLRGGGHRRAAISDDDNENDYCGGGGGRSGPLVRSRSCMLGPAGSSGAAGGQQMAGVGGSKSGVKKHEQSGAGSSKMPSWQDQSSVGADGQ